MLQEEMKEAGHSILCSSLSLIGELKGLQKQGSLLLFPTRWEFCKCNIFCSGVSVLLGHVLRHRSSAPFLRCDLVLGHFPLAERDTKHQVQPAEILCLFKPVVSLCLPVAAVTEECTQFTRSPQRKSQASSVEYFRG